MKTWVALTLATVTAVTVLVVGLEWHRRYELSLDHRCEAAGGRRVDIGVGQKLCFTEDWRWVKI